MAVLAQALFPLVRGDLVALALLAAGHRSRCLSERVVGGVGQYTPAARLFVSAEALRVECSHGAAPPRASGTRVSDWGRCCTESGTRLGASGCSSPHGAARPPVRARSQAFRDRSRLLARCLLGIEKSPRGIGADSHRATPCADRSSETRTSGRTRLGERVRPASVSDGPNGRARPPKRGRSDWT